MNYRTLSEEELLNLWHSNRNAPTALMAADELMNRIHRGDLALIDAGELENLKENQNEDDA